jgi:heptosyltransferase-2
MLVSQHDEKAVYCVIYRTSSIGDVVLSSVVLDLLAKLPERYFVYWLGRQPSADLLSMAYPDVHMLKIRQTDTVATIEMMRKDINKIDFILDLQKNIRSQIICSGLSKIFKAPVFGWQKRTIQRSLMVITSRLWGRTQAASPKIQTCENYQFQSMLECAVRALQRRGDGPSIAATANNAEPRLPVDLTSTPPAWIKELKFGRWLAVAPGASHETKRAPTQLFVSILQELLKTSDRMTKVPINLLFLGDQRDREYCKQITDDISWPHSVLNLAGKLSLFESGLACSESDLLLSNDSSLAHISEAVSTPVAVLFGPTAEAFGFAPRLKASKAFSSKLGCRPCSKHGKASCRYGDQLCFLSIPAVSISEFIYERVANADEHV